MSATQHEEAPAVDEVAIRPAFHHAFIKTTRLDEMKQWYGLVLGLEPNFEWEAGAFMTNDDANHRVVFVTNPALEPDPQTPHARLNHTAYEFPTVNGLLAKYARLRDQEIYPYMSIDHGLTLSIYYMDPNGYGIELQADSFAEGVGASPLIEYTIRGEGAETELSTKDVYYGLEQELIAWDNSRGAPLGLEAASEEDQKNAQGEGLALIASMATSVKSWKRWFWSMSRAAPACS